ncbi:MAG: FAD-binding oxidoreductase [Chloroflexota bacterium]
MFDVVVVGKGLMGSAAFRYLSAELDKVVLVGPDEPENWQSHDGVFASHHDQGRITRVLDADPVWARLAQRSLASYGEIERRSGIRFHHAAGGLRASAVSGEVIDSIEQIGNELEADFKRVSAAEVNEKRPFFNFPTSTHILWEHAPAGYINPRSMVAAQVKVGEQQGGVVVRETAVSLKHHADSIEIITDSGQQIRGRKVLLAMGAYTNMLLPERPLPLQRRAHMILRAEIDEAEQARLAKMPTLIYVLPEGSAMPNLYMLPPVPYPDGKTYTKLGGSSHWQERIFASWDEIRDWFHSDGDPKEAEALKDVLHQTLPNLQVQAYKTQPCILTYTPHEHPFITQLEKGLYVATGGCGAAAKSSDEIGHLAALQVMSQPWPKEFMPDDFK